MSTVNTIRKLLGHIISAFFVSKAQRRYIRKLFENYDFKTAKKYKSFKYQIISLGSNCMGRTIPTKYGLKPTKIYGEKTIITDQMFFLSINQLVEFWNTNFEDFFVGWEYSDERQAWVQDKYNSYAPHEFQLSKEEFIKTIKKRVENFYEIMNTPKFAIFYRFDHFEINKEEITLLNNKIKEARQGKPYKLVIINLNKPIEDFTEENVVIVNTEFTLPAVTWQNELFTEEGKKFCNIVLQPIRDIISTL